MRSGIREVLSQAPQVRKAVLFGSRALGTWKPASDIDLALWKVKNWIYPSF
ncbi:nucleotidyltransferase domain-containing protein [Akkermansia muciniphila]|nr:nucleotidyltransferase domain-containing protein [Akkermansia muciniphila]